MASSSRQDGRSPSDLRPISIKLSQLARADGSAKFGFGPTAALASFSGPIEVRLRDEQPDKATLEIVHRPLQGVGDTSSRALEATLTAVLTPILQLGAHPRALVQVVVQSLSTPSHSYSQPSNSATYDDPSHTWPPTSSSHTPEPEAGPSRIAPMVGLSMGDKAAAINAVSVAALDAGSVGLRGVPVALALALIPRRAGSYYADTNGSEGDEGVLVLDPTEDEERSAYARFGFGWVRGVGLSSETSQDGGRGTGGDVDMEGNEDGEMELVWSEAEGSFTRQQYDEALRSSRAAAGAILNEIRQKLAEKFQHR